MTEESRPAIRTLATAENAPQELTPEEAEQAQGGVVIAIISILLGKSGGTATSTDPATKPPA
jgi:hypothetical protein